MLVTPSAPISFPLGLHLDLLLSKSRLFSFNFLHRSWRIHLSYKRQAIFNIVLLGKTEDLPPSLNNTTDGILKVR